MLFFVSTSAFPGWLSSVLFAFLGLYGVFVSSALLLLVVCFIDALLINKHEGNMEVLCSASAEENTIYEALLYLRHDVIHGTLLQVRRFLALLLPHWPSGCSYKGVFSSGSRQGNLSGWHVGTLESEYNHV